MKNKLKFGLISLSILAMILACFLPLKFTKTNPNFTNDFESFSNSYNEMMIKYNNQKDMKNIVFDKNELTCINQNYYVSSSLLFEKEKDFYDTIASTTKHSIISKNNLEISTTLNTNTSIHSSDINLSDIAPTLNINIEETDEKVMLSKPYAGKRIMLKSHSKVDPLDAIYVVDGYKGYQILQFATEESTKKAYEYYKSQPEIEFVVLDALITTTNDINFTDFNIGVSPYMLTNSTSYKSWGADDVGADSYNQYLSSITQSKKKTTYVAVLDSGVDTDHPNLAGRLDFTYARKYTYDKTSGNTTTSDGKDYVEDALGHGTHVSGIIADLTPSNVKIIPIKVIEDNNTGNLYSSVLAMLYITDLKENQGVNICAANLSLGSTNTVAIGSDFHKAFSDATQTVRDQDISVVVAAGNSSDDCIHYCPANVADALTISNITSLHTKSSSSCYGSYIDLTAPGHQVYSTAIGGGFKYLSGTSMAAPHVAACVALLNVYNYTENYTVENVESLLLNNALDLGETSWDGHGLVNLEAFAKTYTITLVNKTPSLGSVSCVYNNTNHIATQNGIVINVPYGHDFIYTTTANINSYISKINDEDVSKQYVDQTNTITIPNIISSQTISVEFAIKSFTIDIENSTYGSIVANKTTVNYGDNVIINITPNTGYKISAVYIDNEDIGSVKKYEFACITSNHSVRVDFIIMDSSNVSLSIIGNGKITDMSNAIIPNNFVIYEDSIQEFKFLADTNHKVKSVKINDADLGAITYYKLTPAEKNYSIEVTFEEIICAINLNLNQNVHLTTTSDLDNIVAGSTIEFKINLEEGFEIDHVLVNGKEYLISNDTLTIENIQEDTTVTITVKEIDDGLDLNLIITLAIIGTGVLSLLGLAFAITKRKRPY